MKRWHKIVSGLVLLSVMAGCSTAVKEDDPYAVRVRDLEARVARLDQLFKNQSLENLAQRIDDLQDQVKQLRGEVEVLEHDSDMDKKQQRDLYQDIDKRLQKLELGLGGSAVSSGDSITPAVPASTGVVAPASGPDEAAYQRNFDLLKQGRFSEAIAGFKGFMKKYPDSPLAPNALFWTGEAHYQMGDFTTALADFRNVLKQYPKSGKIPDATLKVGYCQYELQQWKTARQTLNDVIAKYPDSSAAQLARQRLQRMQDEGH